MPIFRALGRLIFQDEEKSAQSACPAAVSSSRSEHHWKTQNSWLWWKFGISLVNWNLSSSFFYYSSLLPNCINGIPYKSSMSCVVMLLTKGIKKWQTCKKDLFWLFCAAACTAMLKGHRGLKIGVNTHKRTPRVRTRSNFYRTSNDHEHIQMLNWSCWKGYGRCLNFGTSACSLRVPAKHMQGQMQNRKRGKKNKKKMARSD